MGIIADPWGGVVPSIDLVFVHGLTRDSQQTWSSNNEESWLRNLLAKDIPYARIFTFGFDARSFIEKDSSVSDASYALLHGFEREREDEERPVVFVAHSLGGIILQAFLQKCTLHLRTSITGIIFLGTPNFGLHEKCWVDFAAAMSAWDYTSGDNSRSFISGDMYMSQLGSISDNFKKLLPSGISPEKVMCLYELLPTVDDVIIVKKELAVLPHCDATGLRADHMDMTKFSAESNSNYQIVIQCLMNMYCLPGDRNGELLRLSLELNVHDRLSKLPTTSDGREEFIFSTKISSEASNLGRLALILEDQGHYKMAEENFFRVVELLMASRQSNSEASDFGLFVSGPEDQSQYEFFEEEQSARPDDVATLFCLNKLAFLLCKRGQYEQAERYSQCCLNARIRLSGTGSRPTLLAADNLAISMRYQGRHDDAYDLLWDALENANLTTLDTVPHVKLLDTLARLALDCGLNDVAESVSSDVVRRSICLYGDGRSFTLTCMSNLATILGWTGHISAAEAISRHALDGLEKELGTDHPYCLKAARRLADYIRFQQGYHDASLRLKQILKTQETRLGDGHPDTLSTMRSLGAVYALRGYLKNAEMLLDQAFNGQKQYFGLEHPYFKWTSKALAKVKDLQMKPIPAEEVVQQALLPIFGPQVRSASQTKHRNLTYTSSPFQNSTDGPLFQSVSRGDKECLLNTLNENSVKAPTLGRALREAAAIPQVTFLGLLLDYGAPIDAQSAFHGTALQAASFAGNEAVVELLLERNPVVDQEGGLFGNALRAAVLGRHSAIINLLLGSGLTKKLSQENLNSSIQPAIRIGDMEIIVRLLEAGADINAEDNLFGSPLQQASFFGLENIMATLLDHKPDMKLRAGIFGSSLEAAIRTQNESAIFRLLMAGAGGRSFPDESENTVSEVRRWVKILLESHADSLRWTTINYRVDSWDHSKSVTQAGSNSEVPPRKEHHRSDDPVSTISRPETRPISTPKSIILGIFTSKRETNKDGSAKSGSVKKRLTRRIKQYRTARPDPKETGSSR